jgi:hypothetical protein
MTDARETGKGFSLARWSRRKLEAARDTPPSAATTPAATTPAAMTPAATTAPVPTAASAPATPAPIELPPVESLTFDSDFTAFLRPEVDADLKRAALKQLFRDPRFNVMDGLDTYIDDYTKADPIPSDMLAGLLQRFARVTETGETPAVAAGERDSGDTPADTSPVSAGESAGAEPSAGEGVLPSLANGEQRAPSAPGTGDGIVPSAENDAQRSADEVVPRVARNERR